MSKSNGIARIYNRRGPELLRPEVMKRIFDIVISIVCLVVFAVPAIVIALVVGVTSRGPVFHWSSRVGRGNKIFQMPKFRTMRVDTPDLATHLLKDSGKWITPIGRLLRASSLDELPQLWSILKGDMSFVGPRPALHNQFDLIDLRTTAGVCELSPGLTGWAQINGRDEVSVSEKVELDREYLQRTAFWFDFKILVVTFFKVFRGADIAEGRRNPAN